MKSLLLAAALCAAPLLTQAQQVSLQSLSGPVPTGLPSVVGNCVSMRHNFTDRTRIAAPATTNPQRRGAPPLIDYTIYDWTIDYSKSLATFGANGGVMLSALPPDTLNPYGSSTVMSTTRYMPYGRIEARIQSVSQVGFVTSFITMADIGDEIDWEMVNGQAQTNVFYHINENDPPWNLTKLDPEKGDHYSAQDIGSLSDWHIYVIDWKHDVINYYVDGLLRKSFSKAVDGANSPQVKSGLIPYWYPVEPGLVQISLWDAGDTPALQSWAGGATDWSGTNPTTGRSAIVEYVDIQCYDDKDNPVPRWPANTLDNRAGYGVVDPPMNPDGTVNGQSNPFVDHPSTNTSNLPSGSGGTNATFSNPANLNRPAYSGAIRLGSSVVLYSALVLASLHFLNI
ncbi:concanavalin A-like lectin/glucanase domain-containing protein [Polychytrium aggregatum]|uniref:concanavalin A-like lectin/glucanase domain-containing protein n=1 Tax=Polychytrium aggregatum TaxID=110093 RepID=UPI0022FDDC61|nr:concanavalin A-like lectin/glucanase domain-containing protein [Polychytrium aggregatum]KAI9202132.1 concanavalin A-like lectin/glucanase domain-containing protein [Polychytrium aggregatum]